MTREDEILGMALWAERHHGAAAPTWIAAQIGRLALAGEPGGVALWTSVAAAWQDLAEGTRQ